jgi:CRISPR/Cas system-associated exonuclease Cas4 (RecB family)
VKVIRSSDIGSYLYCRRAWWYRLRGHESANQAEMAAGTELHRRHGRKVLVAGFQRTAAWLVLLIVLVLIVAYFTQHILQSL